MGDLIVDDFCGGGGASTGISWATGRSPDVGLNHNRVALGMHEVNHPETNHLCQHIWSFDPDELDGDIGLAWFSPDCKHFSKAKGGRPADQNIRNLAWIVVRWARRARGGPRVIILENVEEFLSWGPLDDEGRPRACDEGRTFKHWVRELRRLGYAVEWRQLCAADYGPRASRNRTSSIGCRMAPRSARRTKSDA